MAVPVVDMKITYVTFLADDKRSSETVYSHPFVVLTLILTFIQLIAATGAVFIAAVGVWGVFKMAFWVAKESGRSLNPGNNNDTTPPPQNSAQTVETEEGSSRKIASAASPRIPTPLEQQLRLQQEIRRRVLGGEWRVNAPSYHHSMAVE